MIGIVGGIGPYSGLDLLKKVFDNTLASSDQEHIDTVLISASSKIEDRTEYLIGKVKNNPAKAIANVIVKLQNAGVTVVGIPCNTAHSYKIFDEILNRLKTISSTIKVLNMIDETASFISDNHQDITKVGLLSTTGTYKGCTYNLMYL